MNSIKKLLVKVIVLNLTIIFVLTSFVRLPYPAFQTYVSHQFHVVLEVPAEWQITRSVPDYFSLTNEEVYGSDDGVLIISALTEDEPVDVVCDSFARDSNNQFGSNPVIKAITAQGQPSCIIQPSADQPDDFSGEWAAVVTYPEPAKLGYFLDTYYHVLIISDEAHIEPLASSVRFEVTPLEYLESTLDILEHTGLSFNEELNWDEVRADAISLAEGAETTADTYHAIKLALQALKTGHNALFTPAQVRGGFGSDSYFNVERAVVGERLENSIGYVELHSVSGNLETLKGYANRLQQIIQDIDQETTCGWVVDLRDNTGGDMAPMLAGLAPIIGNGDIGGFVFVEGQRKIMSLQDGKILLDGEVVPLYGDLIDGPIYNLKESMPPVAVLVSGRTASSGEITALAFVGRPDSQLFGEPTSGKTTTVTGFPLFDGALLYLTVGKDVDRNGTAYDGSIIPDELVSYEEVLDRAVEWLLNQPSCTLN